jgi:predicted RNase H-like nuclease (RuvC/YqgF family)
MNDLTFKTLFLGFLGALGTIVAAYIGKLLLTPNERIKQLNEIIIQHTELIHDLTNQVREVITENSILKKRISELEDECRLLRDENNILKLKINSNYDNNKDK